MSVSRLLAAGAEPIRCVTIDVEDYFHIESAFGVIERDQWKHWPSRVERNVDLLLQLFDRHKRRGTFFVLGYVAKEHPAMVRRIAAAGHEIASHGTMHERLHRLDPDSFRDDLLASKSILEDLAQTPVLGYRAPTFSIVPATAWAIDVLIDAGFQYDASIFPVRHHRYGVPGAPDRPFWVHGRQNGPNILELPPLTWRRLWRNWPVAGGGYFRLLPLWFMQRGLAQARRQQRPAVLYFHPWEFDPDMPRMPLSFTGRLRTYTGLRAAAGRLGRILAGPGRWVRLADVLHELRTMANQRPAVQLDAMLP
ncbi:MAG: XrtA system polysaccharide deacetylase [Phycisphaeraceae bacterium]